MKNKLKFLVAILLATALTSCIKMEDFTITGINKISPETITHFIANVGIENHSGVGVKLKEAKFKVSYKGKELGGVTFGETEKIKRRSQQDVDLDVRLNFANPLLSLRMMNVMKKEPEAVVVNGTVVARAGLFTKRIEVKDMKLSEFITTFGTIF